MGRAIVPASYAPANNTGNIYIWRQPVLITPHTAATLVNPFRTAVPFWVRATRIPTSLSPIAPKNETAVLLKGLQSHLFQADSTSSTAGSPHYSNRHYRGANQSVLGVDYSGR